LQFSRRFQPRRTDIQQKIDEFVNPVRKENRADLETMRADIKAARAEVARLRATDGSVEASATPQAATARALKH